MVKKWFLFDGLSFWYSKYMSILCYCLQPCLPGCTHLRLIPDALLICATLLHIPLAHQIIPLVPASLGSAVFPASSTHNFRAFERPGAWDSPCPPFSQWPSLSQGTFLCFQPVTFPGRNWSVIGTSIQFIPKSHLSIAWISYMNPFLKNGLTLKMT